MFSVVFPGQGSQVVGMGKEFYDKFEIVKLRPSTVYGYSPRLRCDIVFNNLLASGYTTGNITIKSEDILL